MRKLAAALLVAFLAAAAPARAQLSQATVDADINTMLQSCGNGCNTAASLRALLAIMTTAAFQPQGANGLTLSGTPSVGQVPIATGATAAAWASPPIITIPGLVTGSSGAASANATLINAAIQSIGTAGGGTIYLPCGDIYINATIDNNKPFVLIQGCGGPHNVLGFGGSIGADQTYATRIMPTFACSRTSPALYHRTPSGSTNSKHSGGGFKWIAVDGNSVCGEGLTVNSVTYGQYEVAVSNTVGTEAVYVTTGITGTDTSDAADVQQANFKLMITLPSGSSSGVVLDGSTNANTSFNTFNILARHCNGHVLDAINADNNFFSIQAARCGGGTGNLVMMRGTTATKLGGYRNTFVTLSGIGAIFAEGTGTAGVTQGVINYIANVDASNLTPAPTNGLNSLWSYRFDYNVTLGMAFGPIGIADSATNANACRNFVNATAASMYICNGTNAPLVLSNTAASLQWLFSYDSSDLKISEIASGNPALAVKVPNLKVVAGLKFGPTSVGKPTLATGEFYYDNFNGYAENNSPLNIFLDTGAAAPGALIAGQYEIIKCKGDNTTFPNGCAMGYYVVADRSDVVAGTKGVLYGAAISMRPIIARNNSPADDVAGLVIQNDSAVASAKATDAIYIGIGGTVTGSQWVTGVLVAASTDYAYRATGAYTNGVDFVTAGPATFSGSAFKSTGFSVDGSGNVIGLDVKGSTYHVGATAGASCTLTTVAHLTVVNGIVTLCN